MYIQKSKKKLKTQKHKNSSFLRNLQLLILLWNDSKLLQQEFRISLFVSEVVITSNDLAARGILAASSK